jgi:hypothetical protein
VRHPTTKEFDDEADFARTHLLITDAREPRPSAILSCAHEGHGSTLHVP